MIERLLENWLTRANERSFQIPFCHWLSLQGHTVVHLSRHCAMEVGKDILSIAPDGIPCAYQLKGVEGSGRMTLAKWREDLSAQLHPLVHRKIIHPSVPVGKHHRSYIVVNGDLSEEVVRDIDDFNRSNADSGFGDRKVEVIVRGELFRAFKELQSDFWATNLGDLKTYLELFLEDGRGQLPKAKLSALMEASLPIEGEEGKPPSRNEVSKAAAGCAIICASSISAFTNAKNHLAEFEAWTMYYGYVLALIERWDFPLKHLRFAIQVAHEAMYSALARLCDELMERQDYSEGIVLSDRPVYEVRMTHLLGLMGIYGLWRARRILDGVESEDQSRDEFLRRFALDKSRLLFLWGEYAVPQFLAHNFFRRTFDSASSTDSLYCSLIKTIVNQNLTNDGLLANPYYEPEDYLPHLFGLNNEPLEDSFRGSSYYLEGLLHLLVREDRREDVESIFPDVTRMGMRHYAPAEPWRYYRFRDRSGKSHHRFLKHPQSWSALRVQASEDRGDDIPVSIKDHPIGYLCLLSVYPHRVNSSGLRWVSSRLLED